MRGCTVVFVLYLWWLSTPPLKHVCTLQPYVQRRAFGVWDVRRRDVGACPSPCCPRACVCHHHRRLRTTGLPRPPTITASARGRWPPQAAGHGRKKARGLSMLMRPQTGLLRATLASAAAPHATTAPRLLRGIEVSRLRLVQAQCLRAWRYVRLPAWLSHLQHGRGPCGSSSRGLVCRRSCASVRSGSHASAETSPTLRCAGRAIPEPGALLPKGLWSSAPSDHLARWPPSHRRWGPSSWQAHNEALAMALSPSSVYNFGERHWQMLRAARAAVRKPATNLSGTCAVVGSSAAVFDAKHGSEIDAARHVLRLNNAPVPARWREHIGQPHHSTREHAPNLPRARG